MMFLIYINISEVSRYIICLQMMQSYEERQITEDCEESLLFSLVLLPSTSVFLCVGIIVYVGNVISEVSKWGVRWE